MSFQQGLSGLSAASKSLEAIGNNVANANTVGFKSSLAQFADVYASSLSGASATQVGIGTKVAQVSQQFTQGNITASNNPLDVAVNGNGFFRMSDNGAITYTRNGQFQLDSTGYIVNANGNRLTGFAANDQGVIIPGALVELNIDTSNLPPSATTEIEMSVNLDSDMTAIDPAATAFDMNDPTTYHHSTSVTVYDSLGNSHVLQTFYVKTAPAAGTPGDGIWNMYAVLDGTLVESQGTGNPDGTITFDGSGAISTTSAPVGGTGASDFPWTLPMNVNTGATTPFNITLDLGGSTQYSDAFNVNTQTQDGFASGRLSGFSTGADGVITGRYTNGKSAVLGQVVLTSFVNPNGLQPLGDNAWAETSLSGQPLVGTPGTGSLGVLQSSAVEDSNVDLTAELVAMITAQRVYQANSQTIKTQDQLMQTLVNLR